jgi:hypothetical protein
MLGHKADWVGSLLVKLKEKKNGLLDSLGQTEDKNSKEIIGFLFGQLKWMDSKINLNDFKQKFWTFSKIGIWTLVQRLKSNNFELKVWNIFQNRI